MTGRILGPAGAGGGLALGRTGVRPSAHRWRARSPTPRVAISPDGTLFAIAGKQPVTTVFDLTTGQPVGYYASHRRQHMVAISPDNRYLGLAGSWAAGPITIWDLAEQRMVINTRQLEAWRIRFRPIRAGRSAVAPNRRSSRCAVAPRHRWSTSGNGVAGTGTASPAISTSTPTAGASSSGGPGWSWTMRLRPPTSRNGSARWSGRGAPPMPRTPTRSRSCVTSWRVRSTTSSSRRAATGWRPDRCGRLGQGSRPGMITDQRAAPRRVG